MVAIFSMDEFAFCFVVAAVVYSIKQAICVKITAPRKNRSHPKNEPHS
jgi:hypothetical protein